MKNLNVLVFDDSPAHRKAAQVFLAGHNVTVVGTYDEAEQALSSHVDEKRAKEIMCETGYKEGFDPWDKANVSEEARNEYFAKKDAARKEATVHPNFDVVLTDLLVPASSRTQGTKGQQFVGKEMPLGSIIALLALTRGVKMVAVVTDSGHHDHPASAAFDTFNSVAVVGGDVKVLCTNQAITSADESTGEKVTREFLDSKEGKMKYPVDKKDYSRKGLIYVKAWDKVLARLVGEDEGDE